MAEIRAPVEGEKPVLALDIDGVFILFGKTCPEGYTPLPNRANSPYRFYKPAHKDLLIGVLDSFDPYYITSHRGGSHEDIGQPLGLPEFNWINFAMYTFHPDNNGESNDDRQMALENFFPQRSIVWMDDDLQEKNFEWAIERTNLGYPTLLIKPDSDRGLEEHHIDTIKRWLGELAIK